MSQTFMKHLRLREALLVQTSEELERLYMKFHMTGDMDMRDAMTEGQRVTLERLRGVTETIRVFNEIGGLP